MNTGNMVNDYFISTQRGLNCIQVVIDILKEEEKLLTLLKCYDEDCEAVKAIEYRIGEMKYALTGNSNDRSGNRRCSYCDGIGKLLDKLVNKNDCTW